MVAPGSSVCAKASLRCAACKLVGRVAAADDKGELVLARDGAEDDGGALVAQIVAADQNFRQRGRNAEGISQRFGALRTNSVEAQINLCAADKRGHTCDKGGMAHERVLRECQSLEGLGQWAGLQRTDVSEGLTAMAGANAAAPSGPRLFILRLSCAHERDKRGHRCDEHEEGWEP